MNKRKLSKIFSTLVMLAIVVTACMYPAWYVTQINKVRGMYLVWRGDRALRKYKFQQAIDYYNRGLILFPGHYSAWFNLGNIYVVYEDYYSAVDAYENAIKHNPNYVIARMNYGIVSAERLGDFDGAISQYKTILGIRQKLPIYIPYVFNNMKSFKTNIGLAYYNMGLAYRQKSLYAGDMREYEALYLKEAIKNYIEAVKILKNNYDAHYNLGLAYHIYGDFRKAGLMYCKAIELAPLNYDAHYNLSILLRNLKFYKESIVEMQKATMLITEKDGVSNRQRYIFDVLNDISRRYMENKEALNYMVDKVSSEDADETPNEAAAGAITYINGHFVMSDDFDKAMMENYRKCGSYHIFADEEDAIDDIIFDSLPEEDGI